MNPSRSSVVLNLLFLSLLTACLAVPIRARADEFVMPFGGYLSVQFVGGEAGGVTTFGLGTSPSNFVALLSGLPNTPSSLSTINVGFFASGTTIHFGMFTTFSGASGWAFSNGTDQAWLVAFLRHRQQPRPWRQHHSADQQQQLDSACRRRTVLSRGRR